MFRSFAIRSFTTAHKSTIGTRHVFKNHSRHFFSTETAPKRKSSNLLRYGAMASFIALTSLTAFGYFWLQYHNLTLFEVFQEVNWMMKHPTIRSSKIQDALPIIHPEYTVQAKFASSLVQKHMNIQGYPGATVAVVKDGKLVWAEGFGYADVENLAPASHRSSFRIASISKAMTAMCALKMWERGELDIDRDIREYLPDLKLYYIPKDSETKEVLPRTYKVTTRQLLSHLSGIRHYNNNAEYVQTNHYRDVEEALELFIEDPLTHLPGEKYLYSSFGYNLASVVMQKAAGVAFPQLMKQMLFTPLDMKDTREERQDVLIPCRAHQYVRVFDKSHSAKESYKSLTSSHLENAPYVDNSSKYASGGLMSTAKDVAKFGYQTICGDFLKEETKEMMTTPQICNDGTPTSYGIGWSLPASEDIRVEKLCGRAHIRHSGGACGGTSMLYVLPQQNISVAVICNQQAVARLGELCEKIAMQFETIEERSILPYSGKTIAETN